MRRATLTCLVLGFLVHPSGIQAELPVVEEVPWQPLRDQCRQLLQAQGAAKSPLPEKSVRSLELLLDKTPEDPEAAARAVQKLLDAHCLLGVSINPESRVKAAREPADGELRQGQERVVLIRVHNEAGVTNALQLQGPQLLSKGQTGEGFWLRADLVTDAPFGPKLTGQRLEYRLLRLVTRETGKREATFQFDVGQGTQDLGFRAEVPILFTIQKKK